MPSCNRFFDDLAECLLASECVRKHGRRPQECIEAIMRSKLYDRAVASPHELAPGEQPVLPPPEFTPFECVLKHQAYQECKINLMNPRKRFRTPYGGAPPKDSGSAVFNDVLGKDAPNERPETA